MVNMNYKYYGGEVGRKKFPDTYYIKVIEPLYIICHLQTIVQKGMLQIQKLEVFIASENKHHK